MRVRHQSCNTADCSWESIGYREQQCAQFDNDNRNIHGVANDVKWVPKYEGISDEQRCQLHCSPKGSSAFYELAPKVKDGTPCGLFSDDICVNGECRQAGCDHILDSSQRRDMCGLCGGNNSTCRWQHGAANERGTYGYNFIVAIPAGATNIDIRQNSHTGDKNDDNYLALTNSNKQWILNGDFQVLYSCSVERLIDFSCASGASVQSDD